MKCRKVESKNPCAEEKIERKEEERDGWRSGGHGTPTSSGSH